jgi:F-type H+-transporting ATPase subunit g
MLGAYRQPLLYNLSVTREVLKHIYLAERLQPPTSLSAVQSAYATLWARACSPAYWRQIAGNGEWARVGVYAVEAFGIFKIGEILGKRSLVGYNLH